jgi:hypothetical protein
MSAQTYIEVAAHHTLVFFYNTAVFLIFNLQGVGYELQVTSHLM